MSSAVSFGARVTVATGLDFMASGLRVNQPINTCCCGIWRGEAFVKMLMVFDSRVFTSGSAFGPADCFFVIAFLLLQYYGKIPLKVVGFFKAKRVSSRGSQQRDSVPCPE